MAPSMRRDLVAFVESPFDALRLVHIVDARSDYGDPRCKLNRRGYTREIQRTIVAI